MPDDSSASKIKQEFRHAFWEWLPGFAGGVLPLLCFALSYMQSREPAEHEEHLHRIHLFEGFVEHLLVLVIVMASVSIVGFTARSKIGPLGGKVLREGRGPMGILTLLVFNLVYAVNLYNGFELNGADNKLLAMALCGVVTALVASYSMEVAIVRYQSLPAPSPEAG